MKKIFVRKIFPYDPTFNGKYSKYDGYKLIALQKNSPNINKIINIEPIELNSLIFTSPLKRAEETAGSISKKLKLNSIVIVKELSEVLFDLQNLVSKDEYEKFGSALVRKRFIEAFISDELEESRGKLEKRIKKLLKKIERLPDGNYLLISHSFFMKILQVYLKENKLFLEPEILRKEFNYRKKTFDFGKGFDFQMKDEIRIELRNMLWGVEKYYPQWSDDDSLGFS